MLASTRVSVSVMAPGETMFYVAMTRARDWLSLSRHERMTNRVAASQAPCVSAPVGRHGDDSVAASASRQLAAAEGLPAHHVAVTAAASQIGNPCLPSFHLLLTLCTIILLRWNEGGVASGRVGAHAEGRRGAA